MHDCHGHLDDHAFAEEVLIIEDDVFADEAGAGAEGVDAEELLEGGMEERAIVSHGEDVDVAGCLARRGGYGCGF